MKTLIPSIQRWMIIGCLTMLALSAWCTAVSAQQDPGTPPAKAQDLPTAEEIINAHLEATGGEAKHREITSLRSVAKMNIPAIGMEAEITTLQKDGKGKVSVELPGVGKQMMGFDGETAWQLSDMTGAEILEGEARDTMVTQLSASPLLDLKKFFDSIECTGTEEFNGEECYVVVCEKKDRYPVTHLFSKESKLHLGTRMTAVSPQGDFEMESRMSDYRDAGGVKMAHKTEADLPGGMAMTNELITVEVNADIPDSELELPEEVKALKDK